MRWLRVSGTTGCPGFPCSDRIAPRRSSFFQTTSLKLHFTSLPRPTLAQMRQMRREARMRAILSLNQTAAGREGPKGRAVRVTKHSTHHARKTGGVKVGRELPSRAQRRSVDLEPGIGAPTLTIFLPRNKVRRMQWTSCKRMEQTTRSKRCDCNTCFCVVACACVSLDCNVLLCCACVSLN